MNWALLCKLLWRYDTEEEGLRKEVVEAKYGTGGGWALSVPRGAIERSSWRAIMKHFHRFMAGVAFEVGNERRVKF